MRSVAYNGITGEGADVLANSVLGHVSMIDFCGIPLASLRENSVTELDLKGKGIGVPESIVLSKLIPSASALTSLKCVSHPAQRLNFAWTCLPLCHQPITLLTFHIGLSLLYSLADCRIGVEGGKAIAAVLGKTQIETLKCAAPPPPIG